MPGLFFEKKMKANFKTRPAVPSDSNLQAQLSVQPASTIRAQGSLRSQERARGFIALSEKVCKAAGSGELCSSPATAWDAHSGGTKHCSGLRAAHRYRPQAAASPEGGLNSRNKVLFI